MAGLYLNEMVWICETAGAGCLILKGRRWWRWGGGSGVEAREGRKRKICGSRRSREGENET